DGDDQAEQDRADPPKNHTSSSSCGTLTGAAFFCVFLYARAAAMYERNSGCGAIGRDLYSGWNWQPRNQGWPSSSMISTNFPSGDAPVTWNPRCSSDGTYSG